MAKTEAALVSGVPPHPGYRERYPWHAAAWNALTRDLTRLPHALLLHGPEGLGKRAFAWRLAQSLLCAAPGAEAAACGSCSSCRRFTAGTHPDLLCVKPLEDSIAIVIDQIREMRSFVALKPHTAPRKLVILEQAEAMNLNSANALLKILEEPPASSSLLLITPQSVRLPSTIRSRCTPVPFRPPATVEAAEWLRGQGVGDNHELLLELAGRAPLRARALAQSTELQDHAQFLKDVEALRAGTEDPLRCAVRWKNYGAERSLEWFQRYLAGFIRIEMGHEAGIRTVGKNTSRIRDLFSYFDVLSEAKSLAAGPLDQMLLLEDILIRWFRLFRPMG